MLCAQLAEEDREVAATLFYTFYNILLFLLVPLKGFIIIRCFLGFFFFFFFFFVNFFHVHLTVPPHPQI